MHFMKEATLLIYDYKIIPTNIKKKNIKESIHNNVNSTNH